MRVRYISLSFFFTEVLKSCLVSCPASKEKAGRRSADNFELPIVKLDFQTLKKKKLIFCEKNKGLKITTKNEGEKHLTIIH